MTEPVKTTQAVQTHPHKYILLRELRGQISEVLDQYDKLTKEGYVRCFENGSHTFKNLQGRIKGVMAKPSDIEFLKEQAFSQAKVEAGLPLIDCGLVEHYLMILPHDIDFPWVEELKNTSRGKTQILNHLRANYNLGVTLPTEEPTEKNATWLKKLREDNIKAYKRYVGALQEPTEEQHEQAATLLVEHEKAKTTNLKEGAKKAKATKAKTKQTENQGEYLWVCV